MRAIIALGFVCASVVGSAGAASAGTRTPRVNARERHQQARIHQGVQSGELTYREAARLEAEQGAIRAQERYYRSDGYVSPAERARLNRELTRTNNRIYRQKHDGQDRN